MASIPFYTEIENKESQRGYRGKVVQAPKKTDANNDWDIFKVKIFGAFTTLPGIATVSVENSFDFTIARQKTNSKPSIVPLGLNLRKITVELLMTTKAEFNTFQDIMNISYVNETSNKEVQKPFEISHPQCALYNIKQVYMESISSPAPNARDGFVVTIKFVEYSDTKVPEIPARKGKTAKEAGNDQAAADKAAAQTGTPLPGAPQSSSRGVPQ